MSKRWFSGKPLNHAERHYPPRKEIDLLTSFLEKYSQK